MRSTRRTPCTRNGWIGYAPDPCIPPRFFFTNPCAPTVRATLHAPGMPHTCYGMQRRPFRPSHNRCTVHPVRVGHTPWPCGLPSGMCLGTPAGVICRRGCCWHPCASAKCTDSPPGALTLYVCCPTAAIWCAVGSGYLPMHGGVPGCGQRRVGCLSPYSAVPSSLPSKLV